MAAPSQRSGEAIAVADRYGRDATIARQAVLESVRHAGARFDLGDAADARSPLERRTEREHILLVRGGVQPVERETGTDRCATWDRTEGRHARGGGRMHPARRLADRAEHLCEARELLSIAPVVQLVRCRELREEPLDREVT